MESTTIEPEQKDMDAKPTTKTSSFQLTAPAGEWTGAEFCGLAGRGTLAVQITTTGPVFVHLVRKDVESLPEIREALNATAEYCNSSLDTF